MTISHLPLTRTAPGRVHLAAVAAGAVLLVAGCSGSSGDGASPGAAGGGSTSTAKPVQQPPVSTGKATVATHTLAPSKVGAVTSLAGGIKVVVSEVKTVEVTGTGPGEVDGPGVAVAVKVRNGGRAPLDLSGFAVTAAGAGGAAGVPSTGNPAKNLTGSLADGETGSGVYVFRMTAAQAKGLTVTVTSDKSSDVATFRP